MEQRGTHGVAHCSRPTAPSMCAVSTGVASCSIAQLLPQRSGVYHMQSSAAHRRG